MKRKKYTNDVNVAPLIIYPKEFLGYIFFTIIVSIVSITICCGNLWFIITDNETLTIIPVLLIIFLFTFHLIFTSVLLITKKTYLEITDNCIKFKSPYGIKEIYISDIYKISEIQPYRSLFHFIVIQGNQNSSRKSSKKIRFILTWFSDTDIENLLHCLRNKNKNILMSNFSSDIVISDFRSHGRIVKKKH